MTEATTPAFFAAQAFRWRHIPALAEGYARIADVRPFDADAAVRAENDLLSRIASEADNEKGPAPT